MEASDKQVGNMRYILHALSVKNNGDWDMIYADILNKKHLSQEEIDTTANDTGYCYRTIIDEDYPEMLKQTYQPPFVIYYEGKYEMLCSSNKIAILNDNLTSNYSMDVVRKICANLTSKCTFVVAFGSKKNNELIQNLIKLGGKIIAVVSTGIGVDNTDDKDLYQILAKEHVVISTYPVVVSSKTKKSEVCSTKLQTTIADKILVGGLSKSSPQSLGIGFALSNNADVFVIPFTAGSNYINNTLIKEGATLVETSDDIVFD